MKTLEQHLEEYGHIIDRYEADGLPKYPVMMGLSRVWAADAMQEIGRLNDRIKKLESDEHLADWLNDFDENEAEGRLARRELSNAISEREGCHAEND
jgi:hypothetical protein